MNKPYISIIIPVYNDEKYLHQALDSAANQTLSEIEIVCVDDGSTDGSSEILRQYSEKDSRFVILRHDENKGTLMARKTGVRAASGDYIIFLDGDDYLALDCCETAYGLISQKNVDIFCFSTEMQDCFDDEIVVRSDWHPRQEVISTVITKPIASLSLTDRNAFTMLWGKIYHSQLVKLAHDAMDDFYCVYGEDLYEGFFLLRYAKSIAGARTDPLMFYRKGKGISGDTVSDLQFYGRVCGMSDLSRRIRAFLERERAWEEYQAAWKQLSLRMAVDCCIEFRRLRQEDYPAAKKMLKDAWEELLPLLGEVMGEFSEEYARQVHWSRELERAKGWLLTQIDSKDKRIQDLEARTAELEDAKAWLVTQIDSKDKRIQDLEAWTAELEDAKAWLVTQIDSKDKRIQELEAWTAELEDAKAWLVTQIDSKDKRIQDLEAWTAELEEAKTWLEKHSKAEETARVAAEEAKNRLEQDKAQLSAKLKQLTDDKLIQFIIKRKRYQI